MEPLPRPAGLRKAADVSIPTACAAADFRSETAVCWGREYSNLRGMTEIAASLT